MQTTVSSREKPEKIPFRLTDRDIGILESLDRYRYLRTGQIHRLHFSENGTMQSARRRLKYLYREKMVGRVIPYVQLGQGTPETAYFLDRAGEDYLRQEKDHVPRLWRRSKRVKHQFLQHALDLSEFRLLWESGVSQIDKLSMESFVADFEIKSKSNKGLDKYELYNKYYHPVNAKPYIVYPDAKIILKWKGDKQDYYKLYFVEIDRGTEELERIRDKVVGYNLCNLRKTYFNEQVNNFRVLIQATSEKRAKNIRAALTDMEGSSLVMVTDKNKVSSESILQHPIWLDLENKSQRLVRL